MNPISISREGLIAEVIDNKLYLIAGSAPITSGGIPYYNLNEVIEDLTEIE